MAAPESPETMPGITKQPHLYARYNSSVSSEHEEGDYCTAKDVVPMRVSLETVKIGSWKYTSIELEDIELLYELESSDLVISTNVRGSNNGVPATFRIRDITAADLSLVNVVPDSLESMVVRMSLETNHTISYTPHRPKDDGSGNPDSSDLDIHIAHCTASVHETGHLRDILVFLKRDYQGEFGDNSMFVKERAADSKAVVPETPSRPQLALIESLPYWTSYIPWMWYSQRIRKVVQLFIILYTFFSVLWAMWQLYRHVNVIHVVIAPLIRALKYYLSPLFDFLDVIFDVFTHWWHTFLSPLNVLRGLLAAPMLQALVQLKYIFYPTYLFFTNLLQSTGLLTTFSAIFCTVWMLVKIVLKPMGYVWQSILNSRIAVASMDFQRVRISWVFNLVLNFIRSICRMFAALIGYRRKEKKIKKAMQSASTPIVSPVTSPSSARPRRSAMPILYKSPLSKQ